MIINQTTEQGRVTLALEGRLDTTTAPALEQALSNAFEGAEALVLDFSGLEYISSAGLRVLLMAEKQMSKRGGMRLIHVNATILEVFEITGFSDILTIE